MSDELRVGDRVVCVQHAAGLWLGQEVVVTEVKDSFATGTSVVKVSGGDHWHLASFFRKAVGEPLDYRQPAAFDPGPGWRKASTREYSEAFNAGRRVLWVGANGSPQDDQRWVEQEPAPPLPTEPYTVVRVTWDGPHASLNWPTVLTLGAVREHAWSGANELGRSPVHADVVDLPRWITGFEVLARPVTYEPPPDHGVYDVRPTLGVRP